MLRSLYTSATGMMEAALRESVVARNLANENTPGYAPLSVQVSEFAPMLVGAMAAAPAGTTVLGGLGGGDVVTETLSQSSPGTPATVANPLAAALTGPGFFVVRTAQGLRYTRDGDFTINASGQLATRAGDPVLGTGGSPIQLAAGARVAGGGAVRVGGRLVGHIRVVTAGAPINLVPVGGGLFVDNGRAAIRQLASAPVLPGALDQPSGDVARQMVDLIQAERAYASCQRMLTMTDQTLNQAVTQVGQA